MSLNHARSLECFDRALKYIPGGVNSPVRAFRAVGGKPFFVQSAKGGRVFDVDGNDYVDYVCSWGPSILGHADEVVIEAVTQVAKQGLSFGIPNPYEAELAQKICEWVPSVEKVRMCNSGTEATMSAIRLARGATGRDKIVKFEGCYHGHSDSLLVKAGSGALTLGQPDSAGVPASFAQHTLTLSFNDVPALEQVFAQWGAEIACVIMEPVPANAGLILPQQNFLQEVRRITQQFGALLIFDEVMTGFRVARGGVQELYGVKPDLSTFGKVIGGGLPVGAFGGRADVMDHLAPLGKVYQAGTLSGNPLAMVAGITQLQEIEKRQVILKLEAIGAELEKSVKEALSKHGRAWKFYRLGSLFCLFFTEQEVTNLEKAKTADLELFKKFFHFMLEHGVYMAPSQFEAGFISLAHGQAELEQTAEVFEKFLETL